MKKYRWKVEFSPTGTFFEVSRVVNRPGELLDGCGNTWVFVTQRFFETDEQTVRRAKYLCIMKARYRERNRRRLEKCVAHLNRVIE